MHAQVIVVTRFGLSVCLSVCLFVCLSVCLSVADLKDEGLLVLQRGMNLKLDDDLRPYILPLFLFGLVLKKK